MANVTALHGAGSKQAAGRDAVSKSVAGVVIKSPPSSLGELAGVPKYSFLEFILMFLISRN